MGGPFRLGLNIIADAIKSNDITNRTVSYSNSSGIADDLLNVLTH